MRVYRNGVNGGCQSKGDQQIVGEGAKDAAHQNISALLAGRTHPSAIISAPVPSETIVAPTAP